MTIESMFGLALATFVFAIIPGPGIMAVVAQSLGRGFGHGLRFTLGLVLGDMVYLFMAMLGMGWIASQLGGYFVILKWAGAAYLIWMGIKCFMAKPPEVQDEVNPHEGKKAFAAGLCVTFGNPKAIAFYCGFLPGFVDMSHLGYTQMAQVFCIIFPIVFLVPVTYAWLAGRGRSAAVSTRLWKVASRTAGGVMIGAGAATLADSQ